MSLGKYCALKLSSPTTTKEFTNTLKNSPTPTSPTKEFTNTLKLSSPTTNTNTNMSFLIHVALIIAMSVAQEPYLELQPRTILKPVDEGVYVSCQAKVPDPELVTEMVWYAPSGERIPDEDLSVNIMESGNPGQLDLTIESLKDKDTGIYSCTAVYAGNQKLVANVTVESFMDIDFGDTPVHQTPHINTEAKIKCTPESRPSALVDWLKDMVAIKRNDENRVIQQDGLLIKNVTKNDEGTYRCRARVPQLGSIKYKDIQVEVYSPPVIVEPPQDLKGVEKEMATFYCKATGDPAPEYSWVDKDNVPLNDKEGYIVDKENGGLTIPDLKPEHTGNYRCTASNPAGDDFKTAFLQVLTKPKIEQYLNITVEVETVAEMKCIVTGDPAPEIVFKKETNEKDFVLGINEDDRISVEQTVDEEGRQVGILKLRSVSRSDDGLYTCTANSEGGVTQIWGHITVEFPPTFEEQPYKEMWSWEQAPVNLTCLATSIPNATVQWFFRRQLIDLSDPNMEVLQRGPLGVLLVNPISSSYFGTYSCNATNRLGVSEWNIELKEAHVPGPVAHAKVEKKTATTITWSLVDPMDDGGLPIQGYRVEYRQQDFPWEEGQNTFWTKGSSYTLDQLVPMETYVFRFAAKNDAGLGEWGGEKVEEMPRHAQPEEPLIFGAQKESVTEIPYPDHYTLQWKVPLDNGREIDYFQINYYQIQNGTDGKWEVKDRKTTKDVDYPGVSSFKLESLSHDAFYKIELRAHNEIGFSTPAEVIIKTAHGPETGENSEEGGLGMGVIVAIIVIALILIIVCIDVTCCITKKAGLTAKIVGKKGQKDKDKEAMLEDGKNTSEDKHEGNGQMKTQKEDEDVKKSEPEVEEKPNSEPTETTPMIQGRLHLDHNLEDRETRRHQIETQRNHRDNHILLQNLTESNQRTPHSNKLSSEMHVPREENPKNVGRQPRIVKMIKKKSEEPSNPWMKNSSSTPALDHSTSDDSIYAKPYEEDYTNTNPMYGLKVKQRPPPLPSRNPNTRLSNTMLSKSQEFLSFDNQYPTNPRTPHYGTQGNGLSLKRGQSTQAVYQSQDTLYDVMNRPSTISHSKDGLHYEPRSYNVTSIREGLNSKRSPRLYGRSGSREILNQEPRSAYHLTGSRNGLDDTPGTSYSLSRSRDIVNEVPVSAYLTASREALDALDEDLKCPPPLLYGSREAMLERPRLPSSNADYLDMRYYDPSSTENKNFISPGTKSVHTQRKTPSISSASTLYQPLNAAQERVPTKTAYGVSAYDEVMAPSQVPRYPFNPRLMTPTAIPTPPPPTYPRHPVFPVQPVSVRLPVISSEPVMARVQGTSVSRPGVPPPPVPPGPDSKKKPLTTVTKVYFREPSLHSTHSHSVDYLDSPFDTVQADDVPTEPTGPSLTSAKSLGSLLDSSQHLRSYGQPTLI
ncbi:hypothetical protein Pmani_024845 [Petrolisthes manimaculis]|uniref:Uncharacterized protein n=1 Tax=Petrolisthes manimaculis TaxID=1843537 RepID=A0AAE1P9A7_9EUCA|nr:hypothetical protein Pmani_024845 [Petrolisthes manimaculis]